MRLWARCAAKTVNVFIFVYLNKFLIYYYTCMNTGKKKYFKV